jgi:hypothetical protein
MDLPADAVDTLAVRSVLTATVETRRGKGELWATLPETTSRLRGPHRGCPGRLQRGS